VVLCEGRPQKQVGGLIGTTEGGGRLEMEGEVVGWGCEDCCWEFHCDCLS